MKMANWYLHTQPGDAAAHTAPVLLQRNQDVWSHLAKTTPSCSLPGDFPVYFNNVLMNGKNVAVCNDWTWWPRRQFTILIHHFSFLTFILLFGPKNCYFNPLLPFLHPLVYLPLTIHFSFGFNVWTEKGNEHHNLRGALHRDSCFAVAPSDSPCDLVPCSSTT